MAIGAGAVKAGDAVWAIKGDVTHIASSLATSEAMVKTTTKNVQSHIRSIGKGMTIAGGAIVLGLGGAVKVAADFEQAITNAASVTGATGEEFEIAKEKMAALAKTLGQTTVFSAREAANAMYDLASKGFDPARMSVEEIEPILNLAAATQSELAFSTETVTGTLRAFGMENKEIARISDVFAMSAGKSAAKLELLNLSMSYAAPRAANMNQSFEETVAVMSKLYDSNIRASTAATSWRVILGKLAEPSKKLNEHLERMGLKFEDVDIMTNSAVATLKRFKEEGFTAANAVNLFGAEAADASLVIMNTAEDVDFLTAAFMKAKGVSKEMAEMQLDTLKGQLKLLASAFESVVIPIGEALIPALTKAATTMADFLRPIAEWMVVHPGATQGFVWLAGGVGSLLLVLGPVMMIMPGVVASIIGLQMATGAASVATVGAAGAGAGAVAAGGLVGAIAGTAGLIIALTIAVPLVVKMGIEIYKLNKATLGATRAEYQARDAKYKMIDALIKQGVEIDKASLKFKSHNEVMKIVTEAVTKAEKAQNREISALNGVEGATVKAGEAGMFMEKVVQNLVDAYADENSTVEEVRTAQSRYSDAIMRQAFILSGHGKVIASMAALMRGNVEATRQGKEIENQYKTTLGNIQPVILETAEAYNKLYEAKVRAFTGQNVNVPPASTGADSPTPNALSKTSMSTKGAPEFAPAPQAKDTANGPDFSNTGGGNFGTGGIVHFSVDEMTINVNAAGKDVVNPRETANEIGRALFEKLNDVMSTRGMTSMETQYQT